MPLLFGSVYNSDEDPSPSALDLDLRCGRLRLLLGNQWVVVGPATTRLNRATGTVMVVEMPDLNKFLSQRDGSDGTFEWLTWGSRLN